MSLKDKIKDMCGRPRYCHLKKDKRGIRCTVEIDGKCTQSIMSCTYPCEYMRYEPMPEDVNLTKLIHSPSKGHRGVNK